MKPKNKWTILAVMAGGGWFLFLFLAIVIGHKQRPEQISYDVYPTNTQDEANLIIEAKARNAKGQKVITYAPGNYRYTNATLIETFSNWIGHSNIHIEGGGYIR